MHQEAIEHELAATKNYIEMKFIGDRRVFKYYKPNLEKNRC